jgi:hypothetical protein
MRIPLLIVALLGVIPAQGGITWVQNPTNGHWYGVSPQAVSWSVGQGIATILGGHLVTIRNSAEQAWIQATFASQLGSDGLWTGFNDVATEGNWVWVSGDPVTFTNWAPGEPDNGFSSTPPQNWGRFYGLTHAAGPWTWDDLGPAALPNTCRPLIEIWQMPQNASYNAFGSGCPGPSAPVPLLGAVPGEVPRLGTTSRLRISNLPLALTAPVFVLGLSNAQDPGPPAYALPLDLGVLGWPGCQQLVSDDVLSLVTTATGQADYTMTVPSSLGLLGFAFHAQCLVLYTPGGVAVSNGVTGIVGF